MYTLHNPHVPSFDTAGASPGDFGASYLERGWEPPEEVVLRRELVHTPGLQPEDIGVLSALLLRDPRLPSTMEAIRRDFQAQGWKMGKDRYSAIQARLTKAGHLARVPVYDPVTQRPTWVTRVYRNPANNEQYVDLGIAASQQVSAEVRVSRDSEGRGSRESRVSPGQSRNAENPQSGAGSRKTRDPESRVSPGQSRNAENPRSVSPPPHPPEEVTTSSPYPLTDSVRSLPSQREEGEDGFASKDLHAAESFLQQLRPPHHMGAASARRYAPLLLRSMAAQGWPSIFEVDRLLLAREVTRDPQGFKRPSSLVPTRIRDLPRYAIVTGADRGQGSTAERCPVHPERYRKGCVPCAMTVPV
ncbi:hypothetical protein ABT382_15865 [Streptomyces pharetrae]|uniref:hypothetical protein n=1 Tax=Streptomyces pharetrae TaxID=291370 RepID=UPI00334CFA40